MKDNKSLNEIAKLFGIYEEDEPQDTDIKSKSDIKQEQEQNDVDEDTKQDLEKLKKLLQDAAGYYLAGDKNANIVMKKLSKTNFYQGSSSTQSLNSGDVKSIMAESSVLKRQAGLVIDKIEEAEKLVKKL